MAQESSSAVSPRCRAGAGLCGEAVPLYAGTRLSLNATPSRYLNRIKASFYYISPCDFAWLHSNYQPCCSTRGFHCSLLLRFYGKWLISHNPNENIAVRELSHFILQFPLLSVKCFLWRRAHKYSGFHAFLEIADTSVKAPQSSLITFTILLHNI